MSVHDKHPDAAESLMGQVAGEFFERLSRGENPQIDQFAERHPEIAELIREVFPALATIGRCDAKDLHHSLGRADDAAPDRLPKALGDFRIVREIGRGGMGVVFEAEQLSMDRRVALKILPLASMLDEKRLARFKNEVRAAATFDHPNIVSIYSVGEERGVHYYAMQLVRGQSMAQVIEQLQVDKSRLGADSIGRAVSESAQGRYEEASDHKGHVPEATSQLRNGPTLETQTRRGSARTPTGHHRGFYRAVARLGRQAAGALHHAHEHGVVHRDIKPANLLLDANGHLWVTDFGLARIEADAGLTISGDVLGTVRYMAPEQAAGDHSIVDRRADVYSLGLSLYELVALQPAHPGDDHRKLIERVASIEPVSLRKLVPSIPAELEIIIGKAIEKTPADRYATAGAMADDLQRFLDDVPIKARRPTLLERSVKWSRRHSDLAWIATLLLVVLTLGSALVASWISSLYGEAQVQRQRVSVQLAETQRQERIANQARIDAERHRNALQQELYALDMKAAFNAWSKGRIDLVDGLLPKHEPTDSQGDIRTFPWYALQALTSRPPPLVMHGHQGPVREVAVHPDGERLVSVGDDGTIRTWDLKSGALLTTIEASSEPLNALAISPDGKLVVTGYQTLGLWDLDGERLVRNLTDHDTTIEEVAFSPDGKYVAAGSRNSVIHLIALPDGATRTFDVTTGNDSLAFTEAGATVTAICNTNDARRLRSWDCATGALVREFTIPSAPNGRLFAPASNGRRIAAAHSGSGKISFCDVTDRRELFAAPTFIGELMDMALSPDDSLLVLAGGDGNVHVWPLNPKWAEHDVASVVIGKRVVLPAHRGKTTSVVYLEDGRLVTCGGDGLIKVWQLPRPRVYVRYLGNSFTHVAFTPEANEILGFRRGSGLQLLDIASRDLRWTIPYDRESVSLIEFSADGNRFATVDETNTIDVWNRKQQRQLASFEHAHDVKSIALSPSGNWLAVTGVDGYTSVWDLTSSEQVLDAKLNGWGMSVKFSPDGKLLALGGGAPEILVFDTSNWAIVHRLPVISNVELLAFHPDGSQLASAHRDAKIRIWNLEAGRVEFALNTEMRDSPASLIFHPSGQTLVVDGADTTVRIWHLPSRIELGGVLQLRHTRISFARHLAFTPDGRTILAMFQKHGFASHHIVMLQTNYPAPSDSSPLKPDTTSDVWYTQGVLHP